MWFFTDKSLKHSHIIFFPSSPVNFILFFIICDQLQNDSFVYNFWENEVALI